MVGDLWLASMRVQQPALAAYVHAHPRWRGVRQVRQALPLLDGLARGPRETRLRMVWVLEARLPPPLVNPPVFDLRGVLLGYPDLLDAEAATVCEYDGDEHREAVQHTRDNHREEAFEHHDLVVGISGRLSRGGSLGYELEACAEIGPMTAGPSSNHPTGPR